MPAALRAGLICSIGGVCNGATLHGLPPALFPAFGALSSLLAPFGRVALAGRRRRSRGAGCLRARPLMGRACAASRAPRPPPSRAGAPPLLGALALLPRPCSLRSRGSLPSVGRAVAAFGRAFFSAGALSCAACLIGVSRRCSCPTFAPDKPRVECFTVFIGWRVELWLPHIYSLCGRVPRPLLEGRTVCARFFFWLIWGSGAGAPLPRLAAPCFRSGGAMPQFAIRLEPALECARW